MAEGKKTFIFYSDWINMVREMPDKESGMLLKHILSYVNDENPKTDNILVKMAFGHMRPLIKSDLKRWESIRNKRKQAGAKGGKKRQANAKEMLANAKQVQAVNVNVNVYNSYIEELRNHFKSNAKYFYKQFPNLQSSKGHLKYLLDEFEGHVMTEDNSDKTEFADWMRHFKNWVTIKVKNGYGLN